MYDADLTADQIAVLCEIGEFEREPSSEDKKRLLQKLVSAGYVERTESQAGSAFKLTAKAAAFLSKRGVGLNEG